MDAARRSLLMAGAGLVILPTAAHALRREERRLFGSPAELLLPVDAPSEASETVWAGLATMHARWNAWKPGDLDELNEALRRGRPHVTAPALVQVLRDATRLETASLGCFNPAIGALVRAWGFHDDVMRAGPMPGDASLARWLAPPPTLAALRIDGLVVRSEQRSVRIDLGAYAKGVAIDWALDRLQRLGVRSALLNLGGNLGGRGSIDGRAWQVGIRDPHGPGLAARVSLQPESEAVVTSGVYERQRLLDGKLCSHIIDPSSARPARGFDSVTVVHPSAALADAAATALLVAGPERWRSVARRLGVDQVLAIDGTGWRVATPRLAPRLS